MVNEKEPRNQDGNPNFVDQADFNFSYRPIDGNYPTPEAGTYTVAAGDTLQSIAKHYGEGILYFCVFAVLAPDGVIPPHRDMPHDINKKRYSHHLHIPLTQADTPEFTVGGETFQMEESGVYEINNMVSHSVVSRGADYHVNLMLDYCPLENLGLRSSIRTIEQTISR